MGRVRRLAEYRKTLIALCLTGALTFVGRVSWGWFEDVQAAVDGYPMIRGQIGSVVETQGLIRQDLLELRRGERSRDEQAAADRRSFQDDLDDIKRMLMEVER